MGNLKSIPDFKALQERLLQETFKEGGKRIRACTGTACTASGSAKVIEALTDESKKKGLDIELVKTGCQGLCQKGPVMNVEPQGFFYQRVSPDAARSIVNYSFIGGLPYRQSLYRENIMSQPEPDMNEIPFYKKQLRIALKHNSLIDPRDINQYIAVGGYAALAKAVESMTDDQVLGEVDKANLRGRGGAGFPAGRKWKHTKSASGNVKFVIANGDEGDPGAFMDRAIMEGDPHSLIEGMLLCAYAIKAEYGIIYVRHEYPLAVKHLGIAIKQAEELGVLGKDILGKKGFNFNLSIREGAGAFVCGESTALVASIEGERGFPRPRPPRLSERDGGVWGYPTNLNNIESYACVPHIVFNGADWFRSIGTENSPGTKVFALTGKVKNTGLVEVPMGISLREIVFDIGGGIIGGKKFKAVQTGGPSGGCLTEEHLDEPVDFDSLARLGSMMGSGGIVIMDEDTCMVDVAKFFLSFTQSESCGKCPPCRIGTYQMLEILKRITSGEGRPDDLQSLEVIGRLVQNTALCGLGQSAPQPILSTLKHFREEYEEHVYDKFCRAGVCSGLGVYVINQTECFKCGLCKEACAFDAVKESKDRFFIDQDYCTKCKACFSACPIGAVKVRKHALGKFGERYRMPADQLRLLERRVKMTLKDIIENKPPKDMVTAKNGMSLSEVIGIMNSKNVGSILVLDQKGAISGIFTERDVLRAVAKGSPLSSERIEKYMTPTPKTLDESTDVATVIQFMIDKKIRHLPVTSSGRVISMITFRDLVSFVLPEVVFMAEDLY